MVKRWAVLLPILHVGLCAIWTWEHIAPSWKFLPTLEYREKLPELPPPAPTQNEVGWDAESEYRPSLEVRAIVGTNPVPALLAGCEVPCLFRSGKLPLLQPLIMPLANRLRLRARIVVLNALLLLLVGLQWILIGRRLDRMQLVRVQDLIKSLPLHITALAILAGLFSLIYRAIEYSGHWEGWRSDSELLGTLCAVLAILIWLLWGVLAGGRFVIGRRRKVGGLTAGETVVK